MKPVKPSSKYFTDRSKAVSFCGFFMFFFCLVFAMPLCASVYLAFWSPAVKGLTILLLFVVSNCEFVAFPLVSWIRCGTCLYRFLIFAPLLTLKPRIFLMNVLQNLSTNILLTRFSSGVVVMKVHFVKLEIVTTHWKPRI